MDRIGPLLDLGVRLPIGIDLSTGHLPQIALDREDELSEISSLPLVLPPPAAASLDQIVDQIPCSLSDWRELSFDPPCLGTPEAIELVVAALHIQLDPLLRYPEAGGAVWAGLSALFTFCQRHPMLRGPLLQEIEVSDLPLLSVVRHWVISGATDQALHWVIKGSLSERDRHFLRDLIVDQSDYTSFESDDHQVAAIAYTSLTSEEAREFARELRYLSSLSADPQGEWGGLRRSLLGQIPIERVKRFVDKRLLALEQNHDSSPLQLAISLIREGDPHRQLARLLKQYPELVAGVAKEVGEPPHDENLFWLTVEALLEHGANRIDAAEQVVLHCQFPPATTKRAQSVVVAILCEAAKLPRHRLMGPCEAALIKLLDTRNLSNFNGQLRAELNDHFDKIANTIPSLELASLRLQQLYAGRSEDPLPEDLFKTIATLLGWIQKCTRTKEGYRAAAAELTAHRIASAAFTTLPSALPVDWRGVSPKGKIWWALCQARIVDIYTRSPRPSDWEVAKKSFDALVCDQQLIPQLSKVKGEGCFQEMVRLTSALTHSSDLGFLFNRFPPFFYQLLFVFGVDPTRAARLISTALDGLLSEREEETAHWELATRIVIEGQGWDQPLSKALQRVAGRAISHPTLYRYYAELFMTIDDKRQPLEVLRVAIEQLPLESDPHPLLRLLDLARRCHCHPETYDQIFERIESSASPEIHAAVVVGWLTCYAPDYPYPPWVKTLPTALKQLDQECEESLLPQEELPTQRVEASDHPLALAYLSFLHARATAALHAEGGEPCSGRQIGRAISLANEGWATGLIREVREKEGITLLREILEIDYLALYLASTPSPIVARLRIEADEIWALLKNHTLTDPIHRYRLLESHLLRTALASGSVLERRELMNAHIARAMESVDEEELPPFCLVAHLYLTLNTILERCSDEAISIAMAGKIRSAQERYKISYNFASGLTLPASENRAAIYKLICRLLEQEQVEQ